MLFRTFRSALPYVFTAALVFSIATASPAQTEQLIGRDLASTDAIYTSPLRSELVYNGFVSDVDDAYSLFLNPAGLALRKAKSSVLSGTYRFDRFENISAGAAAKNIGIAFNYNNLPGFTSRDYILALSSPVSKRGGIGAAFNWHHTNLPYDASPFTVDLGFTFRPFRYISIASVWRNVNRPRFGGAAAANPFETSSDRLEDYFSTGVSIRPMTERITLSAQCDAGEGRKPSWLFGARVSPVPGIEIFGRYATSNAYSSIIGAPGTNETYKEFSLGAAFALGSNVLRATSRARRGGNYDYSRNTFAIEARNAFVRNSLTHKKRFVEVEIGGNYIDEGGRPSIWGKRSKDLHPLLARLESIRRDSDVRGVLLKINELKGSFIGPVSANLYEIREAVLGIRRAGKPVVAYLGTGGSSGEMFLASAADKIVVPHEATVAMLGVSLEIKRLKSFFAKLGVDWDHYTAGGYKSSFHTYYTDSTTAVQREEIRSLVEESYHLLVSSIADGRHISTDKLNEIIDGMVFEPEELQKAGLIDEIGWEKDARTELGKLAHAPKPDKIKTVRMGTRHYWEERWTPAPAIAIVGAYGGIESGKSRQSLFRGTRTMGSETVAKELKAAARCPGVKAIVFRVDSPGGSGLASDEIRNEILRIKREKKIPVIVSMSNIAGSGGYWISMDGDAIFADPFTITGSIGVVFMKPVLARMYEKLGVNNEVFKVGKHADAASSARNLSPEEMKMLGSYIDRAYDEFVDKVAAGRHLSKERVRELAGGRVYFGTQAKELQLIDELGTLQDAVRYAARRAGVEKNYRTVYFKAFPSLWETIKSNKGAAALVHSLLHGIVGAGPDGFDETMYVD